MNKKAVHTGARTRGCEKQKILGGLSTAAPTRLHEPVLQTGPYLARWDPRPYLHRWVGLHRFWVVRSSVSCGHLAFILIRRGRASRSPSMAWDPNELDMNQFSELVGEVLLGKRLTTRPTFFASHTLVFKPRCAQFFLSVPVVLTHFPQVCSTRLTCLAKFSACPEGRTGAEVPRHT